MDLRVSNGRKTKEKGNLNKGRILEKQMRLKRRKIKILKMMYILNQMKKAQ